MPPHISATYIDYIFNKSNFKQYVGKFRKAYKILVPKPDRKDYLWGPDALDMVILTPISEKYGIKLRIGRT